MHSDWSDLDTAIRQEIIALFQKERLQDKKYAAASELQADLAITGHDNQIVFGKYTDDPEKLLQDKGIIGTLKSSVEALPEKHARIIKGASSMTGHG